MPKRKKTHRRRSHRGGLSAKSSPRRKRRRGLHDGSMMTKAKTGIVDSLMGGAGGAGAYFVNKATSGFKIGTVGKVLLGLGTGAVIAAMGAPKMGIGFSGGTTALSLQAGLGDDDSNTEFVDDDSLCEDEVYLTESGEYVRVLNDGSQQYLSDEEIAVLNDSNPYPVYGIQHNMM